MRSLDDIPFGAKVVLPPYGFVHLQSASASDLDVVNAARVSYAKQSDWEFTEDNTRAHLSRADEGLLRYLLKNRHGTPFEHTFFKFHVRAPIFVFREWHRHRIASINEESARYSRLSGDFYIPEGDGWRRQVGRPGRYRFEPINDPGATEGFSAQMQAVYSLAFDTYERLMSAGLAKEIARAVLPVGIYSQMIWSVNARALMNFLSLRNAPDAQYEIRKYAEAIEEYFAYWMPVTYDEFVRNDRVAP